MDLRRAVTKMILVLLVLLLALCSTTCNASTNPCVGGKLTRNNYNNPTDVFVIPNSNTPCEITLTNFKVKRIEFEQSSASGGTNTNITIRNIECTGSDACIVFTQPINGLGTVFVSQLRYASTPFTAVQAPSIMSAISFLKPVLGIRNVTVDDAVLVRTNHDDSPLTSLTILAFGLSATDIGSITVTKSQIVASFVTAPSLSAIILVFVQGAFSNIGPISISGCFATGEHVTVAASSVVAASVVETPQHSQLTNVGQITITNCTTTLRRCTGGNVMSIVFRTSGGLRNVKRIDINSGRSIVDTGTAITGVVLSTLHYDSALAGATRNVTEYVVHGGSHVEVRRAESPVGILSSLLLLVKNEGVGNSIVVEDSSLVVDNVGNLATSKTLSGAGIMFALSTGSADLSRDIRSITLRRLSFSITRCFVAVGALISILRVEAPFGDDASTTVALPLAKQTTILIEDCSFNISSYRGELSAAAVTVVSQMQHVASITIRRTSGVGINNAVLPQIQFSVITLVHIGDAALRFVGVILIEQSTVDSQVLHAAETGALHAEFSSYSGLVFVDVFSTAVFENINAIEMRDCSVSHTLRQPATREAFLGTAAAVVARRPLVAAITDSLFIRNVTLHHATSGGLRLARTFLLFIFGDISDIKRIAIADCKVKITHVDSGALESVDEGFVWFYGSVSNIGDFAIQRNDLVLDLGSTTVVANEFFLAGVIIGGPWSRAGANFIVDHNNITSVSTLRLSRDNDGGAITLLSCREINATETTIASSSSHFSVSSNRLQLLGGIVITGTRSLAVTIIDAGSAMAGFAVVGVNSNSLLIAGSALTMNNPNSAGLDVAIFLCVPVDSAAVARANALPTKSVLRVTDNSLEIAVTSSVTVAAQIFSIYTLGFFDSRLRGAAEFAMCRTVSVERNTILLNGGVRPALLPPWTLAAGTVGHGLFEAVLRADELNVRSNVINFAHPRIATTGNFFSAILSTWLTCSVTRIVIEHSVIYGSVAASITAGNVTLCFFWARHPVVIIASSPASTVPDLFLVNNCSLIATGALFRATSSLYIAALYAPEMQRSGDIQVTNCNIADGLQLELGGAGPASYIFVTMFELYDLSTTTTSVLGTVDITGNRIGDVSLVFPAGTCHAARSFLSMVSLCAQNLALPHRFSVSHNTLIASSACWNSIVVVNLTIMERLTIGGGSSSSSRGFELVGNALAVSSLPVEMIALMLFEVLHQQLAQSPLAIIIKDSKVFAVSNLAVNKPQIGALMSSERSRSILLALSLSNISINVSHSGALLASSTTFFNVSLVWSVALMSATSTIVVDRCNVSTSSSTAGAATSALVRVSSLVSSMTLRDSTLNSKSCNDPSSVCSLVVADSLPSSAASTSTTVTVERCTLHTEDSTYAALVTLVSVQPVSATTRFYIAGNWLDTEGNGWLLRLLQSSSSSSSLEDTHWTLGCNRFRRTIVERQFLRTTAMLGGSVLRTCKPLPLLSNSESATATSTVTISDDSSATQTLSRRLTRDSASTSMSEPSASIAASDSATQHLTHNTESLSVPESRTATYLVPRTYPGDGVPPALVTTLAVLGAGLLQPDAIAFMQKMRMLAMPCRGGDSASSKSNSPSSSGTSSSSALYLPPLDIDSNPTTLAIGGDLNPAATHAGAIIGNSSIVLGVLVLQLVAAMVMLVRQGSSDENIKTRSRHDRHSRKQQRKQPAFRLANAFAIVRAPGLAFVFLRILVTPTVFSFAVVLGLLLPSTVTSRHGAADFSNSFAVVITALIITAILFVVLPVFVGAVVARSFAQEQQLKKQKKLLLVASTMPTCVEPLVRLLLPREFWLPTLPALQLHNVFNAVRLPWFAIFVYSVDVAIAAMSGTSIFLPTDGASCAAVRFVCLVLCVALLIVTLWKRPHLSSFMRFASPVGSFLSVLLCILALLIFYRSGGLTERTAQNFLIVATVYAVLATMESIVRVVLMRFMQPRVDAFVAKEQQEKAQLKELVERELRASEKESRKREKEEQRAKRKQRREQQEGNETAEQESPLLPLSPPSAAVAVATDSANNNDVDDDERDEIRELRAAAQSDDDDDVTGAEMRQQPQGSAPGVVEEDLDGVPMSNDEMKRLLGLQEE